MRRGLIGLILASVVNIFLRSSGLYWVITYAGVLIFVGLTAYDTQKLKQIHSLAGLTQLGLLEKILGRQIQQKVFSPQKDVDRYVPPETFENPVARVESEFKEPTSLRSLYKAKNGADEVSTLRHTFNPGSKKQKTGGQEI